PTTWVGLNVMVGYWGALRTTLFIRWSRAESPLSPLVASMTIWPSAVPVAGSIRKAPLLRRNVPWTVWRVVLSVQWMEVAAGSRLISMGGADFCAKAALPAVRRATRQAIKEKLRWCARLRGSRMAFMLELLS